MKMMNIMLILYLLALNVWGEGKNQSGKTMKKRKGFLISSICTGTATLAFSMGSYGAYYRAKTYYDANYYPYISLKTETELEETYFCSFYH